MAVSAWGWRHISAGSFQTLAGAPVTGFLAEDAIDARLCMESGDHRASRRTLPPPTNDIVERMNCAPLNDVPGAGRTTWYIEIDDLQSDLDRLPVDFNWWSMWASDSRVADKLRHSVRRCASSCYRRLPNTATKPKARLERREKPPGETPWRTECRRIIQLRHLDP